MCVNTGEKVDECYTHTESIVMCISKANCACEKSAKCENVLNFIILRIYMYWHNFFSVCSPSIGA